MAMLWMSPSQLDILLETLADYLQLVGDDKDRGERTTFARKFIKDNKPVKRRPRAAARQSGPARQSRPTV